MPVQVTVPPEVRFGLLSQVDYDELTAAMKASDLNRWALLATRLCEDNVPLFGVLFLGMHPMPHFWKEWARIQHYNLVLLRWPRGHGKTSSLTTATLVHRICYSVIPNAKHEDPRVLAIFETRQRANDRMLAIRQLVETGGPGGLIGRVFRGAMTFQGGEPTPWAGMEIPEIAKKFGEWNNARVSLPHPRRMSKPDPNIASISPGEASVGFHPRLILADDIVGPKTADSEAKRRALRNWWGQAIEPMLKPYTHLWAPHTVFHEEDLNNDLSKNGSYYLMQLDALDRFPDHEDFVEIRDDRGVITDIKLTEKGAALKPLWGCPDYSEKDCPFQDPKHIDPNEGGIMHRPTKDLILQWKKNPLFFASQMMHVIRRTDQASIKPWMLRFFCQDPNCKERCFGKVARWHEQWGDWFLQHPDAGMPKFPPEIVLFNRDGATYRKGEAPSPIETAAHGWDLAFGARRVNDRTVCARAYRTKTKHIFMIFEKGRWKHDEIWRKVVSYAVTDPIFKPPEVALEVDNQGIFPVEIRKMMAEMNVQDRFQLKEVRRTKDKDIVLHNSGLPIAMNNGVIFCDVHDEDAILELLSVTPDQSGGHDDCLDSACIVYERLRATGSVLPGFLGQPLGAR